jgi:hypothetical protein
MNRGFSEFLKVPPQDRRDVFVAAVARPYRTSKKTSGSTEHSESIEGHPITSSNLERTIPKTLFVGSQKFSFGTSPPVGQCKQVEMAAFWRMISLSSHLTAPRSVPIEHELGIWARRHPPQRRWTLTMTDHLV